MVVVARLVWMLAALVPAAVSAGDAERRVQLLEQQCEAAREEQIRPLREAEIAKCKAQKRNDPEYCERFWRDYGAAYRRPNGSVQPRLFDDLPQCIEARDARKRWKEGRD